MKTELDRFAELMPPSLYAGDEPRSMKKVPCDEGLKMRFLALPRMRRRYLAVRIPRPRSSFEWELKHSPPPTLTVADRHGSIYLYRLNSPVYFGGKAKPLPQKFFLAVEEAMRKILDAEQVEVNVILNPCYHDVDTTSFPRTYDLNDFTKWFDLEQLLEFEPTKMAVSFATSNDVIFESVRTWAYKERRHAENYDIFLAEVKMRADELNSQLPYPMTAEKVKQIARRIGRWVWTTYDPTKQKVDNKEKGAIVAL